MWLCISMFTHMISRVLDLVSLTAYQFVMSYLMPKSDSFVNAWL